MNQNTLAHEDHVEYDYAVLVHEDNPQYVICLGEDYLLNAFVDTSTCQFKLRRTDKVGKAQKWYRYSHKYVGIGTTLLGDRDKNCPERNFGPIMEALGNIKKIEPLAHIIEVQNAYLCREVTSK